MLIKCIKGTDLSSDVWMAHLAEFLMHPERHGFIVHVIIEEMLKPNTAI